jgi:hypothetical protein
MDTKATQQSKPQWRYDRPHRVRFFVDSIHANDATRKHANELYWDMAKKFSLTPVYQWVEANGIDLQYTVDDRAQDWHKQIRFYGDLTEAEYVDYALRFFDHHNETWK